MRRTVLVLASMALAVLLASGATLVGMEAQGQTKPNIVFVLTDDQFPGTENAMPALKGNVTSQGVKFTNMTSTFPLCCPGRATHRYGCCSAGSIRVWSPPPPVITSPGRVTGSGLRCTALGSPPGGCGPTSRTCCPPWGSGSPTSRPGPPPGPTN